MTRNEFMQKLEEIIEEAKTGILATVDKDGKPSMRWMTPGVIRGRPETLFAVTSKNFAKYKLLKENPNVTWQIQTRTLDKVVTVEGLINVIDNSSLKTEVLEAIGSRLNIFWRVNKNPEDLIVLETVIKKGKFFLPMKGTGEVILFEGES